MYTLKKGLFFPWSLFVYLLLIGNSKLKLSLVLGMLTLWGGTLRDTSVPVAIKLLEASWWFARLWSRLSHNES